MASPTRHPTTGTYHIRLAVPAALRDRAKALYGVRAEFKVSLKTKDPREAKALAPSALAKLQAMLTAVRDAEAGKLPCRWIARRL